MAHLEVKPKSKKSNWWLWLLLVLVIAAVAVYFLGGFNGMAAADKTDTTKTPTDTTARQPATKP
jgi:flagellar basal body-associated protein FliL